MSWYWKEVDNKDSAHDATRPAVGISYLIAAVTGLIAILSIAYRKPILGLNAWALVDAGLFAVIGWRIGRLSRAWTVAGLALYILEVGSSFGERGLGISVVAILFILAYINAVRGVFAYHRFAKEEQSNRPLPSPTEGTPPV
jgi:hypothetical protein